MTAVSDFSAGICQLYKLRNASSEFGIPRHVLTSAVNDRCIGHYDFAFGVRLDGDQIAEFLEHPEVGVIYAIGFLRYVKIGFTKSLESRLSTLQGACPLPLTVYRYHPGRMSDERALHKRFAHARLEREWFYMDRRVAAWVRRRTQ